MCNVRKANLKFKLMAETNRSEETRGDTDNDWEISHFHCAFMQKNILNVERGTEIHQEE